MDLDGLLVEVPEIFKLLSPISLKALHQTSRAQHQQVHDFISTLCIDRKEQVSLLVSKEWPALTQLGLRTQLHPTDLLCLSASTWKHTVSLNFAQVTLDISSLYMLANGCWPLLQHLDLSSTNLYGRGMAALHRCKWPKLKTLAIKNCNLNSDSIAYLTAACWPHLQYLQLLGNSLLLEDVAQLCKGNWLQLNRLDLCGVFAENCFDENGQRHPDFVASMIGGSTDPAFMQHLSSANWPAITQLRLRRCGLEVNGIQLLVSGQWSAMQDLDLSSQEISTAMFAVLGQAQWPELTTLNVSCTLLDMDGTSELVKATWPNLQCLDVSHNHKCRRAVRFGASAIGVLATGNWPLLEKLNMHGNYINSTGMSRLVQGKWPLLKVLDVSCHGLDMAGVQTLMCTRSFPLLECLEVPLKVAGDFHEGPVDLEFYREPRSLELCLLANASILSVSRHHSNLRQLHVSNTKGCQENDGAWFRSWDVDCSSGPVWEG